MYNNIFKFISAFIICFTITGCVKTVTETKVEYIRPEIPESIISPCELVKTEQIHTNGDLLMAYVSLQSAYVICASKVTSIANILQSYNTIYTSPITQDQDIK